MSTVLRRWADQALANPSGAAVRAAGEVLSHHALAALAAGRLAGLTGSGPVVIRCADPVDVVAALLACQAAGRTFVPLDARLPEPRVREVLTELGTATVVTGRAEPGDGDAFLALAAAESPADNGYVYFTSGSTGRAKGIRGSLRAVAHFVGWEITEFGIGAGTAVSQLTSPGFDAFLRDVFVPLCAGGVLCVPPPGEVLAGARLADWLEEAGVEVVHCVPTVFRTLRTDLSVGRLPALRVVLLAGEPLRAADVAWWRSLFGDGKSLVNLYGPSETTMTKLFHRTGAADTATVPVGLPMPGVTARVLDPLGREVPAGSLGEVELGVPFPLLGYLGGDKGGFDAADPHRYRTGDVGRIRPDGALELLGRRDHQVKINGVRVELGAVEAVLRRHSGVRDVCAVEADGLLCAYVVGEAADRDLAAHVAAELPAAMVPGVFVRLAELPRTLSGKVDRRRLPAHTVVLVAGAGEPPRDELENAIAAVWAGLLGLPAVGRTDEFALLGGDSLAAARLLDRLRLDHRVDVSLRDFLAAPTVAALADRIRAAAS
ncbi:hypothetical protein BS329_35300 [Amycolatopsis coloradensis]|uniref:Carrier domain-containing protein n=1 Tax=Amycolatopsis coloradensis TaxID=76021 RepID=A0A1R0KH77_9PSEU|nr:non-ribosomal peptide synthetase [Amycolatopsis coloradensis]OLZ45019.1 hypothetical protein BS329_35300 [Amycolatopsis coloradensis]